MKLIIPLVALCGCTPFLRDSQAQQPVPHPRVIEHVVYQPYPVNVKSAPTPCMEQPRSPQELTNQNMELYIAALVQAGADCRAKAEER